MSPLLVVAGEGSGDAFAAPVVEALGVPALGLGGAHLARAGVELLAETGSDAAMGIPAAVLRAPVVARALARLARAVKQRRPRAALLVGWSEVNAVVARFLRRSGVRTLWYAPPQVWAWRPGRARPLAARVTHLAVVLPFEEAVWARAGARVTYVGHPALAARTADPEPTRRVGPVRIAILPGSRSQEVHAHLGLLLEAGRRLATSSPGAELTVVRAGALGAAARAFVATETSARGARLTDAPLRAAIAGHQVALAVSGTATLECALLAVPPVIVYRTDPVTYAIAERLVRVPHLGLPNLVLGRRAFPELVQRAATPAAVAAAARSLLDDGAEGALATCRDVRRALEHGLDERTPAHRVAALLAPLLG